VALGLLYVNGSGLELLAKPKPKKAIVYIPPLGSAGTPTGRREAAGSRGECTQPTPPLTAIVPLPNWGLAVSERPIFWFYIPSVVDANITEEVEFVLKKRGTSEEIYQTTFHPKDRAGLVAISLPETVSSLELAEFYDWTLSYQCTPSGKSPERIYLDGFVVRVELPDRLKQQLAAATTERERIALYAENGFWQDALTELARLYQNQPNNPEIKADWLALLRSIGLESLAGQKIDR
jgi:hypothetical protein